MWNQIKENSKNKKYEEVLAELNELLSKEELKDVEFENSQEYKILTDRYYNEPEILAKLGKSYDLSKKKGIVELKKAVKHWQEHVQIKSKRNPDKVRRVKNEAKKSLLYDFARFQVSIYKWQIAFDSALNAQPTSQKFV